jgi:adhesin transport system membrane fusion protein
LLDGDADYVTEASFAALQGARRQAHWILWGAGACVLIAIVWASLATLDEVTVGQGQVIPSGKVQIVQNLEGGIVSEILVEPGQVVRRGQPLMRIDEKRFSSCTWRRREGHRAARTDRAPERGADLKPFAASRTKTKPDLAPGRDFYESRHRDFRRGSRCFSVRRSSGQELAEMEAPPP